MSIFGPLSPFLLTLLFLSPLLAIGLHEEQNFSLKRAQLKLNNSLSSSNQTHSSSHFPSIFNRGRRKRQDDDEFDWSEEFDTGDTGDLDNELIITPPTTTTTIRTTLPLKITTVPTTTTTTQKIKDSFEEDDDFDDFSAEEEQVGIKTTTTIKPRTTISSIKTSPINGNKEEEEEEEKDSFESFEEGDDDNLVVTTSTKKSVDLGTSTRKSTTSEDVRHRTIRQTDDEDLIGGSGEEGSGDGLEPTLKRKYYRITLLIKKVWTPPLQSSSSSAFKKYEDELKDALSKASQYEIINLQALEFTNVRLDEYVQVKFDLGLEDVSREEIEKEFSEFLNLGAIEKLNVRKDGFKITDISSLIDPYECGSGELRCRNSRCVPISFRCDGNNDCLDGSDELNCPTTTTPITTTTILPVTTEVPDEGSCRADDQVRCFDGNALICADQVCDGQKNCPGGEDEDLRMNCTSSDPCPPNSFSCDFGKCLPNSKKCDRVQDCDDGSDESFTDCRNVSPPTSRPICIATEFQCISDGSCIPLAKRCDENYDCSDRSDELNCPTVGCRSNQYKCERGGKCIDFENKCDDIEDCPDGDDERGCQTLPVPQRCRENQFQCGDGSCIRSDLKCDAFPDCPDGSDEEADMCKGGCSRFQFECSDKTCIDSALVCDNYFDCPDSSDESPSLCPEVVKCQKWEFECEENGDCIEKELVCNGKYDCPRGSDERNNCTSCRNGEFRCLSGGCIEMSRRCDFIPDCRDNSDEDEKLCNTPSLCGAEDTLCGDGTCVSFNFTCDGTCHCPSCEDETNNCPPPTPRPTPAPVLCRPSEFRCSDGSCVSGSLRCNGRPECPDSSDENNCPYCNDSFRCSSSGTCIDSRYKCDGRNNCPSGEDELGCVSACNPSDQFTCKNGQCIPINYRCDEQADCADGSDEDVEACGGPKCSSDQFSCILGGCIPKSKLCDNAFDCPDGSDEVEAACPKSCRSNEFTCLSDRSCISQSKRCNLYRDCVDGSDEQGCPPIGSSCSPGQFRCKSGNQCVPLSSVCNNVYDCNDYSDENENCQPPEGLNLKTYPSDQSIKQGNEVVFQCRDEGQLRASVRWIRGNGLPLPPGSRDSNGRLEMPNISVDHSGTYICEAVGYPASTPGARVSVYLRVDPYEAPPTRPPSACGLNEATCNNGDCISKSMICDGDKDCPDGSDEMRCRGALGCEPNEFQCSNKKCVLKTWRCDGDDDCGDRSDESNCRPPPPGSPCRYDEYQCRSGSQCIPKGFQCDGQNDCPDRSDEYGCIEPRITTPPPSLITLDVGNIFNISCQADGVPTPEVVWRLNWGHIPDKCITSSTSGRGVLTCEDIQYGEQGAYSCEAINSLGSIFAIPDCTLVVRTPTTSCPPGYFGEGGRSGECLACYCFGQSTTCSSLKLYSSTLPPPTGTFRVVSGDLNPSSGSISISESRTSSVLSPAPGGTVSLVRRVDSSQLLFFALPPSHSGDQLRSYGGYLKYRVRYRGGNGAKVSSPDVVIQGNGKTLLHISPLVVDGNRDTEMSVRFWVGQWFKRVYSRGGNQPAEGVEPATREEILTALANLEYILIRASYESSSSLDVTLSNIRLDSASTSNFGLGQALYVEECRCPPGYLGLSCQDCAPGYERTGSSCMPIREKCREGTYEEFGTCKICPCPDAGRRFGSSCYRDADGGVTCSCNVGHVGRNCENCGPGYVASSTYPYDCRPAGISCDSEGSISPTPDPYTQRCSCKENTMGPLCNQCKAGSFHLSRRNQQGCINCFCMGISTQCYSSNYYRTQESTSFYDSPQGFSLVDSNLQTVIREGFTVDPSTRELVYRSFSPSPQVFYWQLPPQYLGNKLSSYGGYLNYTVKFSPLPGGQSSPNSAPDVEMNGNGIRLLYFRRGGGNMVAGRSEQVSVELLEQYWERQDGQAANREHLLMVLANLDALLIKATYTTYSREAYLSEVSFDYSIPTNTGQGRAYEVEQCECSEGYIGLSCQECAFGYTRGLKGLYLGLCERCSCNGHSDECDPKTGVCRNCRGFTRGDFCDECEVGYSGNPKYGDCIPSSSTCRCDPRGSARSDCPDGRNCICKGNTEGPACSSCKRGTFSLDEKNPLGCHSCYCSGVSDECAGSNLYRLPLSLQILNDPHGFTLTDSFRTVSIREVRVDGSAGQLVYDFPSSSTSQRLYWSLPSRFTGNRLSSYGGKFRASREYRTRGGDRGGEEDIDIILVGSNGISLFYSSPPAPTPGQTIEIEVLLKETAGWRHTDGSAKLASRSQFLSVLSSLTSILLRASFSPSMLSTSLKSLSLDTGVPQPTPYGQMTDVEECRCPPGYEGLSCESCSVGFYREEGGRGCRRCPCGANAERCLLEGGRPVCVCRPGFTGVDCEQRAGLSPPLPLLPQPPSRERESVEVRISEPSSVQVSTGESVSFRCTGRSRSNSPLRLSWRKEGGSGSGIPERRGRDDGEGLLVISQLQEEDSGTYVCTATDGYNSGEERASLRISPGSSPGLSPPVLTITPRYLTVPVGSRVEFTCTSSGSGTSFSWTGGRGDRLGPHVRVSGGVMSIDRVKKSDEAEYHCKGVNSGGESTLRTILYVTGEDSPIANEIPTGGGGGGGTKKVDDYDDDDDDDYYDERGNVRGSGGAPSVSISPSSTQVRPGETVRLRCSTTSPSSNVVLEWTREEATLPASATQSGNGELVIYSIGEGDGGNYACTARSSNGDMRQAIARVTVGQGGGSPPTVKVDPERQTVGEGSPIVVRCAATGSPPLTLTWTRLPTPLPSSIATNFPQLTLPGATVEDRGVYVCTAESGSGRGVASAVVEVERREAPGLEIYPGERQVSVVGSSALFQCRVKSGIPSPVLKWERANGGELPTNVEVIQGGVLRFNRITGDEKGEYVCSGENAAGKTSMSAYLDVQIPPKVTISPSTPVRVRLGERVRLECRGEGEPLPSVSWTKLRPGQLEGVSLAPAPDIFRTPQNAVYEISGAAQSDEGSYSCSGRSEAGVVEERIQVIVERNENGGGGGGYERPQPQPPRENPDREREREEVFYFPVGARAELRCAQSYRGGVFEELYLDWQRADGGFMPANYEIKDGSLFIDNVRREDGGRYSCIGTNRQGQEVFSSDAILQVAGSSPPEVTLRPVKQIVRRGDRVFIQCIAKGDEPITINWFKVGGQPFPPSVSVNGPDLNFRSIEVSDEGRYACTATNGGGTGEAVAEVVVNSPPPSPISSNLRPRVRNIIGFEGRSIDITCNLRGSGVLWSKDGGALPIRSIPLGNILTIMQLTLDDAGRYSCESSEGTDEIDLAVEDERYYLENYEGNDEKFSCDSGEQVIPKSQICDGEFDCADGSDEEPIEDCTAFKSLRNRRHSPKKQSASMVSEEPPVVVRITSDKDLVRMGEDVEIRCEVIGESDPFIRWQKVGGGLRDNVEIDGNLLNVKSVVPENGGVYRCVAQTNSGIYDEDYALTIQANPDLPMNAQRLNTQTVPYGSTVRMDCLTELDGPLAYTWSKEGGIIPQAATSEGPTLTVPDLVPEDSGIYTCTATSPSGSVDIPTILTVTGVVPYFTQTPSSYMSLPPLPDSYLTLDIEMSFRPEEKNGLLLYNGQKTDGSGDFISLGLSNGIPEFRFDVGSGPTVVKGDGPVEIGKWNRIKLSRSKSELSMTVNENAPNIGTMRGKLQGLDLVENLYVGGMPNFSQIHRLGGQSKGFVGCVSELIISGKKQQLLKDSQTSRGISTCDTCASHSCENGGICQEGLASRGYKCICTEGFYGSNCETAGESCFPGACGTGKCVNALGGYDCFCPFGKSGLKCERDVLITEPSFTGNSYLVLPTPKALKKLKVGLRIKPESDSDGLLLYSAQSNGGNGDFTALSIRDGHLEFQYDSGHGPAVIRSKREVKVGEWLDVSVEREDQEGQLAIDGDNEVIKGKSPGTSRSLNLNTPLYLGGYDKTSILLHPSVQVSQGFTGCLSSLLVNDAPLSLTSSLLESGNVENCAAVSPCSSSPCLNSGLCSSNSTYEFTCDCPTGYLGERCEIKDRCGGEEPCENGGLCHNLEESYKCSCVAGYVGRNCGEKLNYTNAVAFRGEGYIELASSLLSHEDSEVEEVIEVELSTKGSHGLLFYHGQKPGDPVPDDFISLGLNGGKLEFSWDLGDGEVSVFSSSTINDGEKHTVKVIRKGGEGRIEVDGEEGEVGKSESLVQMLNTGGNIYLGGAPNVRGTTNGKYSDGFTGCIHSLKFNGGEKLDLSYNPISVLNAGPCTSSPETHDESKIVTTKITDKTITNGTTTIHIHTKNITTVEYYYSDEEDSNNSLFEKDN